MSFASIPFFIFFTIVLIGTAIIERILPKWGKGLFLLMASFFFYGYWDARFLVLLFFVIVSSYFTAKYSRIRAVYVVGIIIPLVILGFFKYFDFFLDSIASILGKDIGGLEIILPVGISFYTFQSLSYVIDVKRGKIQVEENFIRLALYVSFFPQLVAGPIVRASDFLPQLKEKRYVTCKNLEWGLQVFVFGLFKKVVLADHLSVFVDDIYRAPAAYSWSTIALAVVAYSLQIYFDFSGYSDMAIGCAKCLGYDFNKNFDLPYIAKNVSEFWKRWHISLSSWLRDYLYIPLGGNRRGKVRTHINLMLTMLLGGLWHGANWTFVAWGGCHGAALCAHRLLPKSETKNRAIGFIKIVLMFAFVSLTWVFFRADSFQKAWTILGRMFTLQEGIRWVNIWLIIALLILAVATTMAEVRSRNRKTTVGGYYPILDLNSVLGLTVFFVIIGITFGVMYTGENPFVYFQF